MNELRTLATQTLQRTATKRGFIAGTTHFNDLWTRDALYASWGAISIEYYEPVKHTLATLALNQRSDGLIPLRVGSKHILLPLIGLPSTQGPVYTNDKSKAPALDPCTLYVITLQRYYEATKDEELLAEHQKTIEQTMHYLETQTTNNLLREKPYASWDDAIKKRGASTYNNALYIEALKAAHKLTKKNKYKTQAKKTTTELKKLLWNKHYFQSHEACAVFDVPANLLAIYLGVTTKQQENNILTHLQKQKKEADDILPKTNYPKYKWHQVYLPFYFIGMHHYHNQGPYWTWIASLELAITQEKTLKNKLTKHLTFNQGIHEILTKEGTPYKQLFYTSEQDFSWTAGILLL